MNGMIFRSFRKRNRSQKNTNTVYSEYSYSGIVPKERALTFLRALGALIVYMTIVLKTSNLFTNTLIYLKIHAFN